MAEDYLWVAAALRGRVCVLAISGELDSAAADELPRRVLAAVDERADSLVIDLARLVLPRGTGGRALAEALRGPDGGRADSLVVDLSELTFIDVAGARALAGVIRTVAEAWPVSVPWVSAPVRRVFELTGINFRALPSKADGILPRPIQDLAQQGEAVRSWARHLLAQSCQIAGLLAATEDQIAVTLTGLAGQRPDAAGRLAALSQTARRHAADYRRRGADRGQLVA